ncbi:sulfatase [Paraliobacillus salinarum]|uniref:sulfatase n=1 Tax=Paraliobacillus salinarum TaxID=1158996 RepID=UPI0015F48CF7|nr:sulfatase [Paraliobacillus salinarum]
MNVICLLSDTFRRDHLTFYNTFKHEFKLPNLQRFAEMSIIFDNAYIGSYPCMPARQDLWTGRLNFLRRGWSPLEYKEQDLINRLKEHGKKTMLVTDHYHLWQAGAGNYHYSFDGMEFIRGQENDNWITDTDVEIRWPASKEKLSRNWEKYARNTAHFSKEEDYFTPKVFQRSIDWLENNQSLEDFFLMIDLFDPHEPFDPPEPYNRMFNPDYTGEEIIWPSYGKADRYTKEEVKHIHALYKGHLALIDKWFGKMLDKLEALGRMEDTVFIMTSDHGFLFGEHNWVGKHSQTLYNHITHTPIIIYHPKAESHRVNDLVQMADLHPTILDALDVPIPEDIHGRSLLPAVLDHSTEIVEKDSIIYGVFGGAIYLTDGDWVFVKRPEKSGPLYWYTDTFYQVWDFGQNINIKETKERFQSYDHGRFEVNTMNQETLKDGVARSAKKTMERYQMKTEHELAFKLLHDELYHITSDYEQNHNLIDKYPEKVEFFKLKLVENLRKYNAPEEQYDRMGLKDHMNKFNV